MDDKYTLTPEQLYTEFKNRGVDKAEYTFSGGGDSGGIDNEIELYLGGKLIKHLEPFYYSDNPTPDEIFAYNLYKPVESQYWSFAGEFSVSGSVSWALDEEKKTAYGELDVHNYEDYDDYEGEEEEEEEEV